MAFTNEFFRYLILYARRTSFKLSSSFVLVLFFHNYIKLAMSTRKVYTGDSKYISYPSINTCQVSSVRKADPCLISRKLKKANKFSGFPSMHKCEANRFNECSRIYKMRKIHPRKYIMAPILSHVKHFIKETHGGFCGDSCSPSTGTSRRRLRASF